MPDTYPDEKDVQFLKKHGFQRLENPLSCLKALSARVDEETGEIYIDMLAEFYTVKVDHDSPVPIYQEKRHQDFRVVSVDLSDGLNQMMAKILEEFKDTLYYKRKSI